MQEKLSAKGLQLRSDSKLCSFYIHGGIDYVNYNMDNKIESIDDIIDIMEEMNFYHTKTNYAHVNKEQLRNFSKRVYDDDNNDGYYHYYNYHYEYEKPISEINLIAKKLVLKTIDKKLIANAPKNVVNLYEKLYNSNDKKSIKRKNNHLFFLFFYPWT